jgi:hypothetical protein
VQFSKPSLIRDAREMVNLENRTARVAVLLFTVLIPSARFLA